MAEEKIVLMDEETTAASGGEIDELSWRRLFKYKTRNANCFTQYNHNCPQCHKPVISIGSGWWVCDNCQIRFIEDS